MADPRAFISFDFDHNNINKILFAGQAKNSKTPFNIEDWSSKAHLPEKEWEELIHAKINKCNMLIILVGKSMSSAVGVVKEIAFAREHNVPIFGIYVDGADSTSNLPTGLPRGRVISWDWNIIASAIDQMMTEGKNK
ncbi:MAG TPA: TIR domain-containing protein [Flavobacterium sp.]|uniref:TIR domain-containing protein n=1 Tax=Flavobacterium sp. TaxID=239 RepID=UPI002DBBFD8B|nr:TIR domain-containing protein [Flavobacterium sp.]HEU4791755.1 TIR domain-containing protein [Flavobacterium sp.]